MAVASGARLMEAWVPVAVFSVRVPDRIAARFDAVAAGAGGRSALVRRLIEGSLNDGAEAPREAKGRRDGGRFMVRLRAAEASGVRRGAAEMSLSPSGWIAALVRRRVCGAPRFASADERALLAILAEVHRIGVNANQVARALNTAVLAGRVLDLEIAAVDAMRRELGAHLAGLRGAFEGNLAYWDATP